MKKRGGAKDRKPVEGRSVTVSVRLDPRLRYIVELAARQQRRSLSSYIEWAIEEVSEKRQARRTVQDFAAKVQELWDVDESDRLAKLAVIPDISSITSSRILWKLVEGVGPSLET